MLPENKKREKFTNGWRKGLKMRELDGAIRIPENEVLRRINKVPEKPDVLKSISEV